MFCREKISTAFFGLCFSGIGITAGKEQASEITKTDKRI